MDERRSDDRREEDMRLATALEEFSVGFAGINHHHDQLDAIVDLIVGTEGDILTGVVPAKGMAPKVDEMYQQFANGGMAVKLPAWSKLLGVILVVFQILLTTVLIVQAVRIQ